MTSKSFALFCVVLYLIGFSNRSLASTDDNTINPKKEQSIFSLIYEMFSGSRWISSNSSETTTLGPLSTLGSLEPAKANNNEDNEINPNLIGNQKDPGLNQLGTTEKRLTRTPTGSPTRSSTRATIKTTTKSPTGSQTRASIVDSMDPKTPKSNSTLKAKKSKDIKTPTHTTNFEVHLNKLNSTNLAGDFLTMSRDQPDTNSTRTGPVTNSTVEEKQYVRKIYRSRVGSQLGSQPGSQPRSHPGSPDGFQGDAPAPEPFLAVEVLLDPAYKGPKNGGPRLVHCDIFRENQKAYFDLYVATLQGKAPKGSRDTLNKPRDSVTATRDVTALDRDVHPDEDFSRSRDFGDVSRGSLNPSEDVASNFTIVEVDYEKMKTLTAICHKFLQHKRIKDFNRFFGLFVYPGTKWCGMGHTAANYDELGEDNAGRIFVAYTYTKISIFEF